MIQHRAWLPALGLMLAVGHAAGAQTPPTPDQARALEAQITTWLKSATGSAVPLPARPVQFTAEGDHYLVRVPLGVLGKVEPADAAFTAKAKQLDGTRWALDDQQFPAALTIHSTEVTPDAPDAKNPSPDGTHKEAVTYRIKVGKQNVNGIIDTSLATPTTSGGTLAAFDMEKEGGAAASISHIGMTTTQTSTRPADAQHADLLSDVTAADYSTKSEMADGTAVSLTAQRLHVVAALSALGHDQVIPLIRMASELGRLTKAGGDSSDGPTPAEKAKLRAMLVQAHTMLTGAKIDESVEGVKFDIAGNSGTLAKADISFGGDAPGDTLTASMGLSLEGLTINSLPPAFAAYVPTRFSVHPTVSNISVAALTQMGMAATAPLEAGQVTPAPDFASLFGNGGINFGFDSLALDVAGAQIAGTGKFTSKSAKSVTGQAELTARGLDALVAKAQSDPLLQQAVPVIIFLKGIARTTADQAVWQITVDNAKVLVNGVDLSAMMGAMGK